MLIDEKTQFLITRWVMRCSPLLNVAKYTPAAKRLMSMLRVSAEYALMMIGSRLSRFPPHAPARQQK
jgi:hypothetical protein